MTSPKSPNPAQAPASVAPARRRRPRWPLIVGAVLLAAVVIAGATYTAINLPRGCGVFSAARHGMPCDVPLPAGATYERPVALPDESVSGITEQGWSFSVAHTNGHALHDFYKEQLAASGWSCVLDSTVGLPNGDQVFAAPETFTASKDTRGLVITYTGATGEVGIVLDDFHAPVHAC
jgi:hypothetical protein